MGESLRKDEYLNPGSTEVITGASMARISVMILLPCPLGVAAMENIRFPQVRFSAEEASRKD